MTETRPAIRLDKWLWQARFAKSRALAARLVADGAVRVNAVRVTKPATAVHVGDGLSFAQGRTVRAIRIQRRSAPAGDRPRKPGSSTPTSTPPRPLEPGGEADT